MAVSVNLLPDIKLERLNAARRKRKLTLIALAILAVGVGVPLITGGILGGQQLSLNSNRNRNADSLEELKSIEGLNEALTAQNQLNSIYNLRDNGEDFDGLLNILERAIAPESKLTSVEANSSGVLEITGIAKDVDTVNIVVQSLASYTPQGLNLDKFDEDRQPFISNIAVTNIDPEEEEGASFTLEGVFNFALLDTINNQEAEATSSDNINPFSGESN